MESSRSRHAGEQATRRGLLLGILPGVLASTLLACSGAPSSQPVDGGAMAVDGGAGVVDGGAAAVDGGGAGAVLAPQTVVVTDEIAQAMTVTPGAIYLVENEGNASIAAARPGTVLVSGHGTGFLRKVRAVRRLKGLGDILEILTDPASLVDALASGSVDKAALSPAGRSECALREQVLVGALQTEDGGAPPDGGGGSTAADGGASWGAEGSVRVRGAVSFTPSLTLDLRIEDFRVRDFELSASADFRADLEITANLSAQADARGERTLWTSAPETFVQYIGPVPVVEVVTLSLDLVYDLRAAGSVSGRFGVSARNRVSVGLKYHDGWGPLVERESSLQRVGPEIDISGDLFAKVALSPRLDVKFYDVAGPYAVLEPYLDLSASVDGQRCPDPVRYLLRAGIRAEVGADVSALGLDNPQPLRLFDYSTTLLEGTAGSSVCGPPADGGASSTPNDGGAPPEPPAMVCDPGGGGATAVAVGLAGGEFACAVKAGRVYCWGRHPGRDPNRPTSQTVPMDMLVDNAADVVAGTSFACALQVSGRVACWGEIQGHLPQWWRPREVPGLADARALAAGAFHVCALLGGGGVSCWGDNLSGQLGDGTRETRRSPAPVVGLEGVVALRASGSGTCALRADRTVSCWGDPSSSASPQVMPGAAGAMDVVRWRGTLCGVGPDRSLLWCLDERALNVRPDDPPSVRQYEGFLALRDDGSVEGWDHSGSALASVSGVPPMVRIAVAHNIESNVACGISRVGSVYCWCAGERCAFVDSNSGVLGYHIYETPYHGPAEIALP